MGGEHLSMVASIDGLATNLKTGQVTTRREDQKLYSREIRTNKEASEEGRERQYIQRLRRYSTSHREPEERDDRPKCPKCTYNRHIGGRRCPAEGRVCNAC